MPQALAKKQLLTQSESLTKVASKIKAAQEGGVLGPEEVKEIAEETIAVLSEAAEMINDVAEGVPADDSPVDDSPLSDNSDDNGGDDNGEDDPLNNATGDEDDDERKRLMQQVGSLQKEIQSMKEASQREKLASEYGALWPTKIAKAKIASFMKSKDSIPILEAKLAEAKNIMSSSSVKVASMHSNTNLYDSFHDDSKQRQASNRQGRFDGSQITMKV